MSQIRGRNTTCEMAFRKYAWSKGVRGYRISSKVSGRPDMHFPAKKLAVFIDGCFWHKCPRCFVKPRNNKVIWEKKISSNVHRDRKINKILRENGIGVLRLWEHEIKDSMPKCYKKLRRALTQRI